MSAAAFPGDQLCFVPLGVGDAFSRRYYSSCYLVAFGGKRLLLDCPHPIRKIMGEAAEVCGVPMDLDTLDGVLLSHLHGDHASGLEPLGFYTRYVLDRTVHLMAHGDILDDVWPHHLRACMAPINESPEQQRQFSDFFTSTRLLEDAPIQWGPFTIECRTTIHHVPTTAFKIRAGGKTLGFSADTAFDETLIEWFADADLFVHETNHSSHTPYEKLAALPESVRARMRLVHYPDDFDMEASIIEPLTQGRLYTV